MGCSKRYLLAATLFMLVSSTLMPAMSEGPEGIDPPGVVLPGKGEPVTMELDVVQDSVVLSSTLDVAGGPTYSERVIEVDTETTLGFMGEVEFESPHEDLSWYLGTAMDGPTLDNASSVDGQTVTSTSTQYGYQLYLLDIDPKGMAGLAVTWTGQANATISAVNHTGASLYIFHNASVNWELLDRYRDEEDTVHVLSGGPVYMPWHYVNRTLSGHLKVILIVVTEWDVDATLSTDAINLTVTYAEYPLPQLDVGADGHVEWGFGVNASTGALGFLDAFNGNQDQVPVTFPMGGGAVTPGEILVPKGVNVTEAYVDYMAYPSMGERSNMGKDVHLEEFGDSVDLQVSDIPTNSHQRISSVLLTDVVKYNVTDQSMEVHDGTFTLSAGHAPNPLSLGQTFAPAHDGPLYGIDVYVDSTFGSPGNLTLHLWNADQGRLMGAPLRTVTIPYRMVVAGHWIHFPFNPVSVLEGSEYAYTLHAYQAPPGEIHTWILGYNLTGAYPNGTCIQNPTLDGLLIWTPLPYDLCFRTHMDLPINGRDASLIMVDDVSGNLAGNRVYFNLTYAEYMDGNWTFEVHNSNDFDISFNWSAWTRYVLFAEMVVMDVGGDGSIEVGIGSASGTVWLDITEGVQKVVDDPEWPLLQSDTFGNVFYRIPLNMSAGSEGRAVLHNLVVRYNGSLTTSDLSVALNEEKDSRVAGPDGIVKVPINITSKTGGTLNVTSVDILYDLPPHSLHVADLDIPEDEVGQLALDTIIFDDYDNNALNYTVVKEGGDEALDYNLSDDNVVEFWGPANWSGTALFHIAVEDRSDLANQTNSFNVTIVSVNDAPMLVGLSDQVVFFETLKQVPVEVLDNDTLPENITVTTSTERVWYDADNGTLSFLYPNGTAFQQVEVNVSDGEDHTTYWINVTPIVSDEPPVVSLPVSFNITLDAQGALNLTSYATDLESGSDELVWSLVSAPPELVVVMHDGHLLQVIPVATDKGSHVIVLEVTDPDENTVQAELKVWIGDSAHPPEILIGDDALPQTLKVERGETLEVNLALQKYWYDQEDYNRPEVMTWEVTSLRPSLFTVEIGKNQELIINAFDRTGAGYMTLRLIDSDGDVSMTESVRVEVVETSTITSSWITYLTAAIILIVVVGALMLVARRRGPAPKGPVAPVSFPEEPRTPTEGTAKPEAAPGAPAAPAATAAPVEAAPGRMVQVMMIHESTSFMTQVTGDPGHALSEDEEDDLIEQATLFAQERFEDANVGTIKAFKFNGDEVLVGKGRNYFLVTRCTGNEFDGVVMEMKRSIINIDVGMGERLDKWYPGQKVTPLEEEMRELLAG